MKEKIKIIIKNNVYNIVVLPVILGAVLTYIIKEDKPIASFILISLVFLSTHLFLGRDKRIKEFKEEFNNKLSFLSKMVSAVLRCIVFFIFLFSIFVIIAGIIDTIEKDKAERIIMEKQQKDSLSEKAYQGCLDKVAKLNNWEAYRPDVSSGSSDFLSKFQLNKKNNEYFDEWIEAGRPNYDMGKGYWERAFMIWMIENHSDFCDEFSISLIEEFLQNK